MLGSLLWVLGGLAIQFVQWVRAYYSALEVLGQSHASRKKKTLQWISKGQNLIGLATFRKILSHFYTITRVASYSRIGANGRRFKSQWSNGLNAITLRLAWISLGFVWVPATPLLGASHNDLLISKSLRTHIRQFYNWWLYKLVC